MYNIYHNVTLALEHFTDAHRVNKRLDSEKMRYVEYPLTYIA